MPIIHALVLTLLSAGEPTNKVDPPPQPKPIEEQRFYCDRVTKRDGKGGGEGCVKIDEAHEESCAAVVNCQGNYTNRDGTVTCY